MANKSREDRSWLAHPVRLEDIPRVTVIAQGHLVKLGIGHKAFKGGGGSRGEIDAFSADSRKRMLETLARVDSARAGFICFLTLTYPDRTGPPCLSEIERDRQSFLKRLNRRFPDSSAIWRREWETRLSGEFVGVPFPHYHFLFFNLPFLHYAEVNAIWKQVLGFEGYLRTEIRAVKSWRQALYYVSKYMAKVPGKKTAAGNTEEDPERRGTDQPDRTRGVLGPGSEERASRSLVYSAYLTAEEEGPERKDGKNGGQVGRFWGIFNRAKFPRASPQMVRLPAGPWLDDAKAMAREEWAGVNNRPGYGFTLFVDDSGDWLNAICALQADESEFNEDGEYEAVPS